MKTIVLLMLIIYGSALAGNGLDSLSRSSKSLPEPSNLQPFGLIGSRHRIESDGVVIGKMKYFIMIHRPDSTVDFKMLKARPGFGRVERTQATPEEPK